MGLVDRFETGQKVLTAATAGAAAPTGPSTALASPGTSQTELMRVFYVVLYPYRADSPLTAGCGVGHALGKVPIDSECPVLAA